MNTEIEAKQLCDEGFSAGELLSRLREVTSVEDRGEEVHHDVYFDTATRSLSAAGLAARCRTRARGRALDVKLVPLVPEMIMRRVEISEPWPYPQPAGPALRKLVEDALSYEVEGRLEEQVTLETRRQRYGVTSEGCRAELCIDDVAVHGNEDCADARFGEVELEFEGGDESAFTELAEVLAGTPKLRRSTKSKYARSCELLGRPAYRYGPDFPHFSVDESARVAARRVCGALLERIEAHRLGTRLGLDLEHLHKMRVATRRLRGALTSFETCFDDEERDWLRSELRWLAAALGEIRDLDVQKLEVARRREASEPGVARGWKVLADELDARWERAHAGLVVELDAPRYRDFIQRGCAAFAVPRQGGMCDPDGDRIGTVAARLIERRARQLKKTLKAWRRAPTPASVHALRISAKKLRYTGMLFRHLGGDGFRSRLRVLARLQDDLGVMQDRVVVGELAEELRDTALQGDERGPYLLVLGQLLGEAEGNARCALAEVEHVLRAVEVRPLVKQLCADATKLAERTLRSPA